MPKHAKNILRPASFSQVPPHASLPDDDTPVFPDAPRWLPCGQRWQRLPREARLAAEEIIMPLYRELVLVAPSGMERTAGDSFVYAAWLEIMEQVELARHLYAPRARDRFDRVASDGGPDVDALVDRMLAITQAKVLAGKFVMKTKALWQELDKDTLYRNVNRAFANLAANPSNQTAPNQTGSDDDSDVDSDSDQTASDRAASDRAATVRERSLDDSHHDSHQTATDCPPPSAHCLLPSADCPLPPADCLLPPADCLLPSASFLPPLDEQQEAQQQETPQLESL